MRNLIAIFDLGRTNKKLILFDEAYHVVEELVTNIPDISDGDGDKCEDLASITKWMKDSMAYLRADKPEIRAVNISSHGASLVHLDKDGVPVTPLYDYMKPLSETVAKSFYDLFGGRKKFSIETGSPALDMLNSGIQLFWLKRNKPELFRRIDKSLHLPQYANFVFTGKYHSDITSIGCHTGLWDFQKSEYHGWLQDQQVKYLLPPPESSTVVDKIKFGEREIPIGIGLHDSSAALLPFIYTAKEPFVLLSTGTWSIALNPFFNGQLTPEDFEKDCLYFLYDVKRKVAASRLFLGNEYQFQVNCLNDYFHKDAEYHNNIYPNKDLFLSALEDQKNSTYFYPATMKDTGPFPQAIPGEVDLSFFSTFEGAYHKLILDLAFLQVVSLRLVSGNLHRLYVTGGFVKNNFFMEALQAFLPDWKIFIAENPRASALGAALAIHTSWQTSPIPDSVGPVIQFDRMFDLSILDYKCFLK